MNKKRRIEVRKAIQEIECLVQNILDEEQESYDNMPESLQQSINGQNSMEAQESMESAISALEDAISCLEEVE